MSFKLPVALCIMAKLPRPGSAKTRLVPTLSYEDAAGLSRVFISDTVANVLGVARATDARAWVAYTPDATDIDVHAAFGKEIAAVAQRGDDFGARLCNTIEDLLAEGHRAVCVIDSDSPTLPPAALAHAVEACDGSDRVVIGPAIDGGYYLLGLARAHAELFANIEWSTPKVTQQTLARALDLALPVFQLQHWYDVDEAKDLATLARELRFGQPAGGYFAPATRALLRRLKRGSEGDTFVHTS